MTYREQPLPDSQTNLNPTQPKKISSNEDYDNIPRRRFIINNILANFLGVRQPYGLDREYGRSAWRATALAGRTAIAAVVVSRVTLLRGEGQNRTFRPVRVESCIFVPSHG